MPDITLADVRKKYPQYKDLSDQKLADALHGKFYSDMPADDFYKKIGFTPPTDADQEELNRARRVESQTAGGLGGPESVVVHSATLGLDRPVNAVAGGLDSLIRGHGFHSGYSASLEAQKEQGAKFQQEHPVVGTGLDVGGAFLTPGGEAGLFGKGGSLLGRVLRSTGTGAAYGAVSGAANADEGLGNRGQGAAEGAAGGGVLSAAIEAIGGPVAAALFRGAQSHFGGAAKVAEDRLREHLAMDGLDKAKIDKAIDDWKKVGLEAPNLLSVAGENTMGLLRAVAGHFGPERNVAVRTAREARENIGPQAKDRTAKLTPDQRPANQVRTALEQQRDTQAEQQFRGPYAEPVTITPEILAEVRDKEGIDAIDRAIASARSKKLYDQMKELQSLKNYVEDEARQTPKGGRATLKGEPVKLSPAAQARIDAQTAKSRLQVPTVSGGALHRVQIELGNMGRDRANVSIASGLFDRAHKLSALLDVVPHLSDARAAYRGVSDQLRALDAGSSVLKDTSSVFSDVVKGFKTDDERRMAQVGARQQIIDGLSGTPRQAQAVLNQIIDGDAAKANLRSLFGTDEADKFIDAAKKMRQRLERAREISPRTGSQTQPRGADIKALGSILMHGGVLRQALRALDHASGSMSGNERMMLMKLGLGNPRTAVQRIFRQGRPPAAPASSRIAPAAGVLAGQALAPQDAPAQ